MKAAKGLLVAIPFLGLAVVLGNAIPGTGKAPEAGVAGGAVVDVSSPDEFAKDLAIDSSGNVYVTGYSLGGLDVDRDYATVKYDPAGNELWVARYNGPGNSRDEAVAIAVDSSGNVYVTGRSSAVAAPNYRFDYATIKYDSEGNELWVARYDGPMNGQDEAQDIAVDAAGNVYVTGNSSHLSGGGFGGYDYTTVKYNPAGAEVWVARHSIWGTGIPHVIALDSSGGVIVTGQETGANGIWDYVTIKYRQIDGFQQWLQRYDGLLQGQDIAYAMTLDNAGNVYVTGSSRQTGVLDDFVTVKYDQYGLQKWVARYDGGGDDAAAAIAVDESTGNVYVTGKSMGSTDYDYATVMYDSAGLEKWVARFSAPPSHLNTFTGPHSLAIDPSGNPFVTGMADGFVYATVKYDSLGNQQWVRYDSSGGTSIAYKIVADAAGNAYVTGRGVGPNFSAYDYLTIKYGPNGERVWQAAYGHQFPDSVPVANAGPDQTVADKTCPRGSELVSLDGTASSDPDGPNEIVEYYWVENGLVIAKGAAPSVGLSVGVHTIELIVYDRWAVWAKDTVIITVFSATASQLVDDLIAKVQSFNLESGIAGGLYQKLESAKRMLEDDNPQNDIAAAQLLNAFKLQCRALSGNALTAAQSAELEGMASCLLSQWLNVQ